MTRNQKNYGTVLVTGASAGIGRELALEFGTRAETLVVVARWRDRLEKLRAELLSHNSSLKVIVLAADLSDERDVERLLGRMSEAGGSRGGAGEQCRVGRFGVV
jgi:short-subunit dehydrogenase